MIVGTRQVGTADEILARREEEGAAVLGVPDVVIVEQGLVAVPVLAEVLRILGAVGDHPLDVVVAARDGRREAGVIGLGDVGEGLTRAPQQG